jgi:hypothetical protein
VGVTGAEHIHLKLIIRDFVDYLKSPSFIVYIAFYESVWQGYLCIRLRSCQAFLAEIIINI